MLKHENMYWRHKTGKVGNVIQGSGNYIKHGDGRTTRVK